MKKPIRSPTLALFPTRVRSTRITSSHQGGRTPHLEERGEGVVPLGLVAGHDAVGGDAVLEAVQLPARVSDLDACRGREQELEEAWADGKRRRGVDKVLKLYRQAAFPRAMATLMATLKILYAILTH